MPHWFLLLLITCTLQLPGTSQLPLMDRDEPRFAGATLEMMDRQTWIVPYFNDSYRFDKPPLTYWWMRLHYQLFGISELSARLHSIIATWLISLILFNLAQRLFDRRTAWLSAMVWLTSLQVLIHGRLCVADMPMILGITLAMRALLPLLGLLPSSTNRHHTLLYGALAFGFLAKGPIALLVPGLSLLLFRWWSKQPLPWSILRPIQGLLLTFSIVAAWGIPALIATQGQFWNVGIGEHVVRRGAEMLNGRPFIPGYYLISFFFSFFPWSGFIIPIIRSLKRPLSNVTLFLLAWFTAPIILFSFYATQLPHYILPAFPAAALITGMTLSQSSIRSALLPKPLLALALLFTLLAAVPAVASTLTTIPSIRELLQLGSWLLASIAICGALTIIGLKHRSPALMIGIVCLVIALPTHFFCSALRKNSATLAAIAHLPQLPPTIHLGWDYTEPSLVFYSRSKWTFTGKAERVHQHLKQHPQPFVTVLQREWTLDHWIRQRGADQPKRDHTEQVENLIAQHPHLKPIIVSGFNPARFSWVEVVLLAAAPAAAANVSPPIQSALQSQSPSR
jgi:4-amino-4-deoxy-L-arabinose transferase-like glycosyltransferase